MAKITKKAASSTKKPKAVKKLKGTTVKIKSASPKTPQTKTTKKVTTKTATPKVDTKAKTAFTREELDNFKKLINEKRKEILEDLENLRDTMMDSTTGEYSSESPSYSLHMEQGTDAMEREKTFMFASREGKFLNYLDDALTRIDKGVYGKCNVCEKLIEKERLEAVPHAQMCFKCKSSQKS
ncbi:MAG: TraR/DksA C4-type zinc finger protein [Bacteroidota bacterium]|nr:TraR/DksA C4-type zinc finger protein [Bacteroidota bacterium]